MIANPQAQSDSTLNGPWTAYRTWACTSKYQKSVMDRDTQKSLWLAIAGAILATIGQQLAPLAPKEGILVWAFKAPGILGSCAVALSAYLAKQALADNRVQAWIRARAAAESLKSGIFLYRALAPPFDGPDRVKQLVSRVEKVLEGLKDLETRPADLVPPPVGQLQVEKYITDRVDEQIEWYEGRANDHQGKADKYRQATGWLGGLGALLALATTSAPVSAWAAVVATITAAITAYLKNQQHQTLAANYQSTALRLRLIKTEWLGSGKTDADTAERNQFIQRCEDTMAAENGAWGALWSQKDGSAPGKP
jgi:hypothetical protein